MENQIKSNILEHINCLVIDDDKFSRTFIKTALYQIGIKNTKEAATTTEATEILNLCEIDLILLDQIMPDKNGIEFATEFRHSDHKNAKDIPIIMITVDTKEKTVLDARNLGIKEYLVKPISPISLKKRIFNALDINEQA